MKYINLTKSKEIVTSTDNDDREWGSIYPAGYVDPQPSLHFGNFEERTFFSLKEIATSTGGGQDIPAWFDPHPLFQAEKVNIFIKQKVQNYYCDNMKYLNSF